MKANDFISKIPSGSPAGELLKIATLVTATILADRIGEIVKNVMNDNNTKFIETTFREDN